MYENNYVQAYGSFSPSLLYSLTLDSHIIEQTKHIYYQTDLLDKMINSKKQDNFSQKAGRTVASCIFQSTDALDNSFNNYQEPSIDMLECSSMKNSQYINFKLKRAQQHNQILQQVQQKCSQKCFLNVKRLLQTNKQITLQLNTQLKQIAFNKKVGQQILQCRQQNIAIKTQQKKILKDMKASEADKQNLKSQQQLIFKKQAALLKRQQAVAVKQKKILQTKKNIQIMFEAVSKDVSGVVSAIEQYNRSNGSACCLAEQTKTVNVLWQSFSGSLQSKLQL